jgi:4-phospho-D-threonate 3-dehydrogenase / 4-phospho-D-erythronate 3-dehydrogenase
MSAPIRIGITMGDPSGVGPAAVLKALALYRGSQRLVVIGDAWVVTRVRGCLAGKSRPVDFVDLANVPRKGFGFGFIRKEYGRASVEYLDKSQEMLRSGDIDCLVTCPISKEAVSLSGFAYPGHTEYLAASCGVKKFEMMMLNDALKFIALTRHIPLKDVANSVTGSGMYATCSFVNDEFRRLFGIASPRIVVCGLNPHASDNGVIGTEENRIIKPAIKKLRSRGIRVAGPISADVAIAQAYKGEHDCVIAIYHDQALIPLKLTGQGRGANITLGLPFVRTSPLHGTAFDIAAQPHLVNPRSLLYAITLAAQCTQNLKKA